MTEVTESDFHDEVTKGTAASCSRPRPDRWAGIAGSGRTALCCADTQAAPWRGPLSEERRPPSNSLMSEPSWEGTLRPRQAVR